MHLGLVQVAYPLPLHGTSGPAMRGPRGRPENGTFNRWGLRAEGVKGVEVFCFPENE